MKIEQAAVCMNSDHTFSRECEFKVESTINFRTVFSGVSEAEEAAAETGNDDRQARLLLMLQELVGRMLALLSGETLSGESTSTLADLGGMKAAASAPPQRSPERGFEIAWTREMTETIKEHESTDF